jgi:hypothetical protein
MLKREIKSQGRQSPAQGGYEKRDVNAKWIFGIVAFLLAAGLIMHFSLAGFMQRLSKKSLPTDRLAGFRDAAPAREMRKDIPLLQIAPTDDLKKFRSQEDAELHTYGWIDRTSGVVRVPIERAMELVLERGLPTRAGSNGDQAGPSSLQLQKQRVPAAKTEGQLP